MCAPPESKEITVREYHPANWFTAHGVALKRKQIERKGVPNMKNWRFVTLTCDQSKFDYCPITAYFYTKKRIREFLKAMRKRFGYFDWCWKREFHRGGWIHFHVCMSIKRKFTHEELFFVGHAWGCGRTNVKRITSGTLDYIFKYATKQAGKLPQWFLDYREVGKDGREVTFGKERFWGTSRGFYTGPSKAVEVEEPKSCEVPRTAREKLEAIQRKFQVIAKRAGGRYVESAVVTFAEPMKLRTTIGYFCLAGLGASPQMDEYIAPIQLLEENANEPCLLKLQKLKRRNRLSLAGFLQVSERQKPRRLIHPF